MKERPILFSAPMVKAILSGSKSQTRRVVKPQPDHPHFKGMLALDDEGIELFLHDRTLARAVRCPYGQPGDRLWVRESFAFTDAHEPRYMGSVEYRADNKCMAVDHGPVTVEAPHNCDPRPFDGPWKPSIHMPRWASRITLEITAVRVERLQDISEADAKAEGLYQDTAGRWTTYSATEAAREHLSPVQAYRDLWEQINGPGSWDANPWVWVVEFKRG